MKKLTTVLVLLVAMPVLAQNPPAGIPSEANMQKMMQQAKRMQTCLADIDQAQLEALGREAEAMSDEIDALCAQGKEQEALDAAMTFARKINTDPNVKKARECSAGMVDMMAGLIPQFDVPGDAAGDDRGICAD